MLKKKLATLIAFSMVSICTLSAYAQQTSKATVETAVENLKNVMLEPNAAALNDLAAEELTYGHSSGKIESKKEFMQAFLSGASVFKTIQLSDQKISILKNTAIVRHILTATTDDPGKGIAEIKLGIVLTWVKVGQSWKLLARQAYRVS